MITYRATLEVPFSTVARVSGWVQAHRRANDVRPWQRAATSWTQALLVLRWFKDDTAVHLLARDAGISQATAYRYLHEAVEVIADRAPELGDVLAQGLEQGWAFVCLDGTLIETTRSGARSEAGHDLWYSGKHRAHGGNIQVLTDPDGFPVWTSEVEPGRTHDITAARAHALGALYPAAAAGMPTLADKGYTGAGIGIHVPTKGANLDPDNQTRNQLLSVLRAPAERANALLKSTWKALRRVTVCPRRIGDIIAAALVLLTMQRSRW
ncbi:transposase [Ornithinimicrobium faecis]|uniref:Transposase n=1 Tax=Ornithinimicrobium faecis TaxID=2934158 RepID=A0ABY4YTY5_9MICO|nr:transposase family protein [Ornithinimicrobium sp. HY1793]USQ79730.1 transposase [Ornithinimicrobium sp. HY1793]